MLPEDQFNVFVGQHQADRYVKKLTCFNQLTILLYAQASGKDSLRDIETGLIASGNRWYHLGLETAAKSTLARANEKRPYRIYESLFYEVLKKCQMLRSGTASFSFKNDLYALDSTTIDLCLSIFPWAKFRREKGAIKLYTLFNVRSQVPELIMMTEGKTNDIPSAHEIDFAAFPKGSIFVFDRGYNDYTLLRKIKEAGHHFVIRMKKNTHIFRILGHERAACGKGILADETIAFALPEAEESYPYDLRLVRYYDAEHDETYDFLTDEFRLSALNIALIYKNRWQIELFFKWIKQHLQIKTFLGTSKNAVLTQIWIAMIYYLLLAWIKFQTKFKGSLHVLTVMFREVCLQPVQIINLLRLNLKSLQKALPRAAPQLSFL
ncbi:IS4 family transposase [Candidatus Peregrinibacteria bacterium]|nr:IS4 family transposase [Candidatus Peregrinibacteria bacterium]